MTAAQSFSLVTHIYLPVPQLLSRFVIFVLQFPDGYSCPPHCSFISYPVHIPGNWHYLLLYPWNVLDQLFASSFPFIVSHAPPVLPTFILPSLFFIRHVPSITRQLSYVLFLSFLFKFLHKVKGCDQYPFHYCIISHPTLNLVSPATIYIISIFILEYLLRWVPKLLGFINER